MFARRIAMAALIGCVVGELVLFRDEIRLVFENARSGCWPWSPAVVDYYPGMTLCPGQEARVRIIVPLPPLPPLPADFPDGRSI